MSWALGMSWLHHQHMYRKTFSTPVPDWVCTLDMPKRVSLVGTALRLRWHLPEHVLTRDEFHHGPLSVWGR